MPALDLSEGQQTQSSWSPDSKKNSEKVSRWMCKLYFGKCVYFYAQEWYWGKISWQLRQSSSGLQSSICFLVLCLSSVYPLKHTCKCCCNLNKNAISELISLLLMPNSEHQDVILLCVSVLQHYCKKKQREGEAKMPACELTAAALARTLAFNAT